MYVLFCPTVEPLSLTKKTQQTPNLTEQLNQSSDFVRGNLGFPKMITSWGFWIGHIFHLHTVETSYFERAKRKRVSAVISVFLLKVHILLKKKVTFPFVH